MQCYTLWGIKKNIPSNMNAAAYTHEVPIKISYLILFKPDPESQSQSVLANIKIYRNFYISQNRTSWTFQIG